MEDRSASRGCRSRAIPAGFVLVVVLLAVTMGSPCATAAEAVDPWTLKAHFLRNFAKLVTWPEDRFEDKDSPIVIGVLGADPFDDRLEDAVEGHKAHGRTLQVRRLLVADEELPSREQLTGCHLLFVSVSERDRVPLILERLERASVMTVSDVEDFAASGGVAEFVLVEPYIRFRLNREVAEASGLRLSSQLLRLAIP